MSRLASGLHRLRRSPWEVVWSALVSCGLVFFSQLAVAMVPRLFPSLSLLAMLPIAGLVFLAAIVVGRFWKRFIGVEASAPLFVLFNILFLWGVYVFVIQRGFLQQQEQERLGDNVSALDGPAGSAYKDHTHKSTARQNKDCNYAKGKWVADEKLPLYSGNKCKQWLSKMWGCQMMQRTDFTYESYRWQPHGCEMPEFSGPNFLKSCVIFLN